MAVMSAPAAKAFSEPVMTTQPIPASASHSSSAAPRASISASLSALYTSGRFRRMRATRSRRSSRITDSTAAVSRFIAEGLGHFPQLELLHLTAGRLWQLLEQFQPLGKILPG